MTLALRPLRAPLLVLVAAVVAAVAAATAAAAPASPATSLVAGIAQKGTILGNPSAPVTLVQYEDLGCTHCLEFTRDAFPTIVRDYVRTGQVKLDFRGLGVITPASEPALRYVLAAGRQNRLWHLVGLFYENQSRLNELVSDAAVTKLVRGVKGLDAKRLVRDAATPAIAKQVRALLKESVAREVQGTPWFFVRKGAGPLQRVTPEAYDGEAFTAILDEALAP